jgi:hypothetical protein
MAARSQFFVTVFAEKQIQRAAPKNCYCHPPVRILYITCSYGLGRKPISILCIRFASSHCLHLPNLPTPHTSYAVASHSLLVPRNFMPFTAPTAANISSYLVISAAKSFPRSSCTSIQAGEFFVYKSVLQVTSSNLSIHHTFHVAASNCLSSAIFRPLFAGHLASLSGSYFPDTCFHTFHRYGDRKVHA